MLFNSYVFVFLFLPISLVGYWGLRNIATARAAFGWLVVCSLFYYGWWNPPYTFFIVGSILANYFLGRIIGGEHSAALRKGCLVTGLAANTVLLVYYKYAVFAASIWNDLTGGTISLGEVFLPLGISFFTFQQMAYLIDSFRGEAREYHIIDYALFVTFFPQLIAGPIVHHGEMIPQFQRHDVKRRDPRDINIGLVIFIIGLAKKVLIADRLAPYASWSFRTVVEGDPITMTRAWACAITYSMQLYFDFSGYTDMAMGAARMFGIKLPLNFHSPYKAWNIVDFWRRWHITLSRFLRDYLYIPLGGNRHGGVRRYVNLLLTMVLGGLWHGAGWTFVIWGALHGAYLCINHAWAAALRHLGLGWLQHNRWWRWGFARPVTLLAVLVGWVYFRAADVPTAHRILMAMAGAGDEARVGGRDLMMLVIGLTMVLFCWMVPNTHEWMHRYRPAVEKVRPGRVPLVGWHPAWRPTWGWAIVLGLLFGCSVVAMSGASEFLYYQF